MITKKPLQQKYQHFTVLNQALINFIVIIARIKKDIRSTTICLYLTWFTPRMVTISWINQIIRREGIVRPIGRPTKEYKENEPGYLEQIKIIHQYNIDCIGIPLLQDVMYHFRIESFYIEILTRIKSDINKRDCNWSINTMRRFIQTNTAIALYPGVKNFEEALDSDISHTPMSPKTARDMVKKLEKSENLFEIISHEHKVFWTDFLKLDKKKQIIYFDGHVKPYFTKQTHVCGIISNSGRIMPGTKYVIATNAQGYVIDMQNIMVNTPYGECVLQMARKMKIDFNFQIDLIILDREGCGNELNQTFKNELELCTLTPLRENQYKGLEDFEYKKIGERLYQGIWRSEEKRKEDERTFVMIEYDRRVCVFGITKKKRSYTDTQQIYKSRWPNNEEIIKNLNMQTDFNVNISNGTNSVLNPKKQKQNEKNQQKIDNWTAKKNNYQQRQNKALSNSESKRYEKQVKKAEEKITKYQALIIPKNEIGKVKIRNTKPDYFISMLKTSIINILRFIIISCVSRTKKPPMEKMYHLIINRKGIIEEMPNTKWYIFDKPFSKDNQNLLAEFVKNFNKFKIKDRKAKVIQLAINSP